MRTVDEILQRLRELAPESMKEPWDNVGLLVGNRSQPVETVLVALDPFLHVAREAQEKGAQLLVCHHPIFFECKSVTTDDEIGSTIRLLTRTGISEISMHTNLDAAPGGVNDALAARLGLEGTVVLHPSGTTPVGEPYGIGRVGTIAPCPLPVFVAHVRKKLGCAQLRFSDGGRPVHRVAVGGGACASFLEEVVALGCDTFVTSDVKYNAFHDAAAQGISLIDAGHFFTENPVCDVLTAWLQTSFPELRILRSERSRDCIQFA